MLQSFSELIADTLSVERPLEGRQTISFLLGAGFSAPNGYPIGDAVNEQLSHFKFENYDISSAGEIYRCNIKFSTHSSQYQRNMVFCERIISEFSKNQHGNFDYEEFFDFIHGKEIFTEPYKSCAEGLIGKFENYSNLVFGLENIFTQMITEVIKDKNGKIWYDNEHNTIGDVDDYDTLLKIINAWSDDYIVDIHTLNHDMLFESFKRRDYIAGKICDGFSEFGSEYYGELKTCEGRKYNVRLERYTGKYNTPVRLYKLHGSFDYVLYCNSEGVMMSPDNCIKTRFSVDLKSLKKDVIGKNEYERFPFAYHGYFLTGIKTKVKQYNNVFFKNIHERFHKNLNYAEKLVIIGYGGKDDGINKSIFENFDYHEKQTIIIDPHPSEELKEFAKELGAKIIKKSVADIVESDIL